MPDARITTTGVNIKPILEQITTSTITLSILEPNGDIYHVLILDYDHLYDWNVVENYVTDTTVSTSIQFLKPTQVGPIDFLMNGKIPNFRFENNSLVPQQKIFPSKRGRYKTATCKGPFSLARAAR